MPDESRVDLLRAIVNNTDRGLLRWEPTHVDGRFQLALSANTITVEEIPSEEVPNDFDYLFRIYNSDGVLIDTFSDFDVAKESFDESDTRIKFFKTISGFYRKVRNSAFGVDEAIHSILQELKNLEQK